MKKALIIFTVVLSGFIGMGAAVYNNDKLFEISKHLEIFSNLFQALHTSSLPSLASFVFL